MGETESAGEMTRRTWCQSAGTSGVGAQGHAEADRVSAERAELAGGTGGLQRVSEPAGLPRGAHSRDKERLAQTS